jgi:DNA polymerase-3 subunit gamma/tau
VTAAAAAPAAPPLEAPAVGGGFDLVAVRRVWPDLLDAVNQKNKTATALLRNAEPTAVDAKTLTLTFSTSQLANMFAEKSVFLREALQAMVGVDLQIAAVAGSAPPPAGGGSTPPPPPSPEEIDVTDATDDEPSAPPADPVALLQSNLGAQVIGEIDPA